MRRKVGFVFFILCLLYLGLTLSFLFEDNDFEKITFSDFKFTAVPMICSVIGFYNLYILPKKQGSN
jgi:hypothetical protein